MRYNMKKEILIAIGIILMFFCVGIQPAFADISFKSGEEYPTLKERDFKFDVYEFKPDGSTEKTIVELSLKEAKKFKNKLRNINSSEERLSLYKQYGFIPEDVTLEKLKYGMEEKAKRNGLTKEKLRQLINKSTYFKYILKLDIMCLTEGNNMGPFRLILGSSSITRGLNAFIFNLLGPDYYIPSIDVLNIQIGMIYDVIVKDGLFKDYHFGNGLGIVAMLSFVGYYIHGSGAFWLWFSPIFTLSDSWFGYCAFLILLGVEYT